MPDVEASPSVTLARLHYQDLGLWGGWKPERVLRLCELLKVTPAELGAACCIRPSQMKRMLRKDRIPPHVALHFALIESWYLSEVSKVPQRPIVPIHLLT